MTHARSFPGVRLPDRIRDVDSHGIRISVKEWGAEDARPLLLVHGGFDFARTFDVFAPLLADGGWRVVSWDLRGHGDSDHTALYSPDADLRDAVSVLNSTTAGALPIVGHSRGGRIALHLCEALPHRITHLVNLEGLPFGQLSHHGRGAQTGGAPTETLADFLDKRRTLVQATQRPGTVEGLAARRARLNPRLSIPWLEYLVTVGARHMTDGWRWKTDPAIPVGLIGPWQPAWSIMCLPNIGVPVLVVIGTEAEPMRWTAAAEDVRPYLPRGGRLVQIPNAGHFVHIEHPREVANQALEHLT